MAELDALPPPRSSVPSRRRRRKRHSAPLLLLAPLFVAIILGRGVNAIRVESLRELAKDASSITLEWSLGDEPPPPPASPTATTSNNDSLSSGERADWLGFKIKYFTERLHYTPVLLKNLQFRRFRLDNLRAHTEYRVQVSAYDALGREGPASNLLSVRTNEAGLFALRALGVSYSFWGGWLHFTIKESSGK